MRAPTLARDALARRLSAALCLALLLGSGWGLHRYTAGFEVWTYEGRRQQQLQLGLTQARRVALRGIDGRAAPLWGRADAPPTAYLVDFIYTRCPSVCRTLGSEYQQLQRRLSADPTLGGVHLVSISFDVEHDDPVRLANYAGALRADPRRWTVAVPTTRADAELLLRSLGVVVMPDGDGGYVHNGAIHLLDEGGRLRGLYEFEQWPQALAQARQLTSWRE